MELNRLPIVGPVATNPGDVGQLFYKALRSTTLVDVETPSDFEVTKIIAGKTNHEIAPGQSWAEVLDKVKANVGPQGYFTVLVKNNADVPKTVEGILVVNQEGAEQASAGKRPSAASVVSSATTRTMHTRVRQGTAAAATRHVTPSMVKRSNTFTKPPEAKRAPAVAGGMVVSRSVSPALAAVATGRHEDEGGIDYVLPREDEVCVLMMTGHALAIERHLRFRAPVLRQFRSGIIRAIDDSLQRTSPTGVGSSSNEIEVVLPKVDARRLSGFLKGTGGPFAPIESERITRAIQAAIARTKGSDKLSVAV